MDLPAVDCPVYYVEEHDTLQGISIKTGVKVTALRRINMIYGNDVFTGQRLKLYASPSKVTTEEPLEVLSEPGHSVVEIISGEMTAGRDADSSSSRRTSAASTDESVLSLGGMMASLFGFGAGSAAEPTTREISTAEGGAALADDILRGADTKQFEEDDNQEIPVLEGKSNILSKKMAVLIMVYLPIVHQEEPWTLLYSLYDHGTDFSTFYSNVSYYQKTIIVVETEYGEVFGGFASEEWTVHHTFRGTGQCFLFKFSPNNSLVYYPWTEKNQFFMWCSSDKIGMGGGGDGFGFVLDSDFLTGASNSCETFDNEPLCSSANGICKIVNVEVWGFKSSMRRRNGASKKAGHVGSKPKI